MSKQDILVYYDHLQPVEPICLGVFSTQLVRGKELFSFSFDREFLKCKRLPPLDPDLQFYAGRAGLPYGEVERMQSAFRF